MNVTFVNTFTNYKVVDATIGKMQIIDKETGLAKDEELLSSVTILHKGNKVNVGSGFTLEERRAFKENLDLIVGKVITVKYFEETTNSKDDSISLRFPTFKTLHGNKREV